MTAQPPAETNRLQLEDRIKALALSLERTSKPTVFAVIGHKQIRIHVAKLLAELFKKYGRTDWQIVPLAFYQYRVDTRTQYDYAILASIGIAGGKLARYSYYMNGERSQNVRLFYDESIAVYRAQVSPGEDMRELQEPYYYEHDAETPDLAAPLIITHILLFYETAKHLSEILAY